MMSDKEIKDLRLYFLRHSDEFLEIINQDKKFKLHFYQKIHLRILSKIPNNYYLFLFRI